MWTPPHTKVRLSPTVTVMGGKESAAGMNQFISKVSGGRMVGAGVAGTTGAGVMTGAGVAGVATPGIKHWLASKLMHSNGDAKLSA